MFSSTIFCPSSLRTNSINFWPFSVKESSLVTNKNGLEILYSPALTLSAVGSTSLTLKAATVLSIYSKEANPIAFLFPATVVLTAPLPSEIVASFVNSSDS